MEPVGWRNMIRIRVAGIDLFAMRGAFDMLC